LHVVGGACCVVWSEGCVAFGGWNAVDDAVDDAGKRKLEERMLGLFISIMIPGLRLHGFIVNLTWSLSLKPPAPTALKPNLKLPRLPRTTSPVQLHRRQICVSVLN